jgi:protein TonB
MAVSRPRIEGERPDFTRISTGIPPEEGNVGFLDPPVITGVGVTGGQGPSNGMLNGLLRNESYRPPPPPPVVKHEPDRPVPITNIESARILNRPQPVYPAIARQTRTQGTVRLEAIISREGYIENLRIIDGHPLLVQAALDAVKQWRYKPTLLNGQAVEVITTIEVHFMLSQ